jgi:WD40 repeat protein
MSVAVMGERVRVKFTKFAATLGLPSIKQFMCTITFVLDPTKMGCLNITSLVNWTDWTMNVLQYPFSIAQGWGRTGWDSFKSVVFAGSDCGNVFIYDALSGRPIRLLDADEDVANCVQCHPTLPVLATSGIEHVVDVWSPQAADPYAEHVRQYVVPMDTIEKNQERMREGYNYLPAMNPRVIQVESWLCKPLPMPPHG